MQQINVVLVLLNPNNFKSALKSLNFAAANLVAIVVEGGDDKIFDAGIKKIPLVSFASIQHLLDHGAEFVWLINGFVKDVSDIWQMKKFLLASGVPEDNIVNFEISSSISIRWLGNLRYIEKFGADFFATGISYTEVGLDLNYIPHVRGRGVNLAGSNQDLLQGYQTAKYVFDHVKPGTIKFVIIGLAPYSFRYDNAKNFSVTSRHLQYMLALDAPERNLHDRLLKILASDNIRSIFTDVTAEHADLNFERLKNVTNHEIPAISFINWNAEQKNLTKKFFPETFEKNLRVIEDYIKLCRENGAEPVGVVFPFAPARSENYRTELLDKFREVLNYLEKNYDFTCADIFDLQLDYRNFYNMGHLNRRGSATASALLSLHLFEKNFLQPENFLSSSYAYFCELSKILIRDDYNELLNSVFAMSIRRLRQKSKLTVGFVLYDSSMWCGDDLYNFFAADERFEPTIFLCLRTDFDDEPVRKNFWRGVEQFKARGLNIVALPEKNSPVPVQDVLIFLTPYLNVLPNAFRMSKLTAETLPIYVPYGFAVSKWSDYFAEPIMSFAWKIFMETNFALNLLERECKIGAPRGYFGGYPRADFFFNDEPRSFDWKVTRPDAKKIIWAPHWSINTAVKYATFQWNYKFMYEFAKAHPEISWAVKPHPNLMFSAVEAGIFPNTDAFEDYLNAWNDLPNAKVVTGGYYQELFATSDGMIHDSGSFIAEYQFTGKPMIFLTRDTQKFNELVEKILSVSYLVDGRDLEGIAALMQKIFIDGDDSLKISRQKFFDDNLNYVKQNGMTASEFIYRAVADELR